MFKVTLAREILNGTMTGTMSLSEMTWCRGCVTRTRTGYVCDAVESVSVMGCVFGEGVNEIGSDHARGDDHASGFAESVSDCDGRASDYDEAGSGSCAKINSASEQATFTQGEMKLIVLVAAWSAGNVSPAGLSRRSNSRAGQRQSCELIMHRPCFGKDW